MNKLIISFLLVLFLLACNHKNRESERTNAQTDSTAIAKDKKQIGSILDSFNSAAAKADFEKYFSYFTDDAISIGTDATENWNMEDYKAYAKPHFDKKKTWNFKAFERHIYFDQSGSIAWFDELLDTQMKICRGSGVLIRKGNEWKICQYVLSMTVPNCKADSVIKIKTSAEEDIVKSLKVK